MGQYANQPDFFTFAEKTTSIPSKPSKPSAVYIGAVSTEPGSIEIIPAGGAPIGQVVIDQDFALSPPNPDAGWDTYWTYSPSAWQRNAPTGILASGSTWGDLVLQNFQTIPGGKYTYKIVIPASPGNLGVMRLSIGGTLSDNIATGGTFEGSLIATDNSGIKFVEQSGYPNFGGTISSVSIIGPSSVTLNGIKSGSFLPVVVSEVISTTNIAATEIIYYT